MSKVSKTARASAVTTVGTKTVIPDEVYVKNLRNDLASGLYVAQEGARALLRTYDTLLDSFQVAAKDLLIARTRIVELETEIAKVKDVVNA